jgi:hypothetical protein
MQLQTEIQDAPTTNPPAIHLEARTQMLHNLDLSLATRTNKEAPHKRRKQAASEPLQQQENQNENNTVTSYQTRSGRRTRVPGYLRNDMMLDENELKQIMTDDNEPCDDQ